jgi:glycosyltransferase involved in cell wall biosynthesis
MKIAFFNPATMAFNVATPETQPLGGMASSICYLAQALAARGHDVTLISMLPPDTPPMLRGVRHVPIRPVLPDAAGYFRAEDFDAVLAVNYPDVASYVRGGSLKTLNIAWLHIFPDQPALAPLPTAQVFLDAAVCVSETQRKAFQLSIPTVTIGNAIAPAFENMFASAEELLAAKRNRAVYASMPFRGLDILVQAMGRVSGRVELDIFSSMRAYQAQENSFTALYELAQRNPRIRYHGGVGQQVLAQGFRNAAYLAYPSTYIETYCIVAQEALAAGLKVISNDLGALPETTMGYADLLPVHGGTVAPADHVAGIAALLEKNETMFLRDPHAWAEERFVQMQTVNRLSTWAARATEWEAFLGPAVASKRGPA